MKLGRVKKQTIRKRFFLHSLHRNFTRLAVITQKTTIKVENLEGGGCGKQAKLFQSRISEKMLLNITLSILPCEQRN